MSIFKDIGKVGKGVLGIIAPTIAGALPGPVGSIAKQAVTKVLGLGPGTDEAAIEQALANATPELLIQLRQADQQFQENMAKAGVDLEGLAQKDRADARARQVALRDKTPPVLAWTIIAGWLSTMGALLFYTPPTENTRLLDILFGILTSAVVGVINYYFGSSAGSARKTEIMGNGK